MKENIRLLIRQYEAKINELQLEIDDCEERQYPEGIDILDGELMSLKNVVKEIDIQNKKIIIDLPEGL